MDLVLYHANCSDGFCAAFIAKQFLKKEAEYIPVQYSDPPPDVTGKDVIILDFSYKRTVLEEMKSKAKSLLVLDHHKTAEQDLKGLDYCVFDMNQSGAMLAHRHFDPMNEPHWITRYVQDRDLWTWRLPQSHEVNAALKSYPYDFDVWQHLAMRSWESMVPEGQAILRYHQQLVEDTIKHTTEIKIAGHTIKCANCTTSALISDVAQKLATGMPFGASWFQRSDGKKVYSLRSSPSGLDVSEIAKSFGGGGHKHAAGFTMEVGHEFERCGTVHS